MADRLLAFSANTDGEREAMGRWLVLGRADGGLEEEERSDEEPTEDEINFY